MKTIIKIILVITGLVTTGASCKKEKAIKDAEVSLPYKIPAGNHSFEQRIVDFYKKYGRVILYDYEQADFRYNINGNLQYVALLPDTNYVANALDSLDKYLFGVYGDEMLQKLLPYKIILSSEIRSVFTTQTDVGSSDTLPGLVNAVGTFSQLAFGHTHNRLTTLSAEEIKNLRRDLHKELWKEATAAGKIEIPQTFHKGLNYNYASQFSYYDTYGLLEFHLTGNTMYSDLGDYVGYITSRSLEELNNSIPPSAKLIRPISTLIECNSKITKLRLLSVPVGYMLTRIKREPGVNPGLSRSCKRLHVCETAYSTTPLF